MNAHQDKMMSLHDGRITNRANPIGKSDRARFIRPVERQRMRPWLIDHLERNDVPGLTWDDRTERIFRIAWKHAANQCFNMEKDTNLFEKWAIHTGRHQDSDHKRWKANFRCALNSLPDVKELKEHGVKKGNHAFKVYKFLDEQEAKINKDGKARKKREPPFIDWGSTVKQDEEDEYEGESAGPSSGRDMSLPNLPAIQESGPELLMAADREEEDASSVQENLQEILTAATASLAAGGDALALEKISIEQLSRLGEVSRMKLDIRRSLKSTSTAEAQAPEHMYVFLCNWCEKVFPSKVELFQHFLIVHQDKLLAGEEYQMVRKDPGDLQKEIADLEQKVLGFTQKYKPNAGDVIEDGLVVDITSTNIMTSQDVYIEDQALDLTVPAKQDVALDLSMPVGEKRLSGNAKLIPKVVGGTKKQRRSLARDMDYIQKFGNYGLAGAPQTKRQLSLVQKKKEELEKTKKPANETEAEASDPSKQHSMEDIVHAEILMSLKSAANEDDDEDDDDVGDDDGDGKDESDDKGDEQMDEAAIGGVIKTEENIDNKGNGRQATRKDGEEKGDLAESEGRVSKVRTLIKQEKEETVTQTGAEESGERDTAEGKTSEDANQSAGDEGLEKMEVDEAGEDDENNGDCKQAQEENETDDGQVYDGNLKVFKCETCSKEFDDAEELSDHMLEHKNEYMCGMCHNIFDNKDTYVNHLESHFPPIEVSSDGKSKSFVCDFCKKSFAQKSTLESHKKTHYKVVPVKVKGEEKEVTMVYPVQTPVIPKMAAEKETREIADRKKESKSTETKFPLSEKEAQPQKRSPPKRSATQTPSPAKPLMAKVIVVGTNGEILKVRKEVQPAHSVKPEDKVGSNASVDARVSLAADTVDGMQAVGLRAVASGSTVSTAGIEEKSRDDQTQLPAFSEIVRDVDEFFIKDTNPVKRVEAGNMPDIEISEDDEDQDSDWQTQKEGAAHDTDGEGKTEGRDVSKCVICKVDLEEDQYNEHMKSHSLFELTSAKESFEKQKPHDGQGSTPEDVAHNSMFKCKLCSNYFETFEGLRNHVASHLSSPSSGTKPEKTEIKSKGAKRGRKRQIVTVAEALQFKKSKQAEQSKTSKKPTDKTGTSILAAALNAGPKYQVKAPLKIPTSVQKDTPVGDTDETAGVSEQAKGKVKPSKTGTITKGVTPSGAADEVPVPTDAVPGPVLETTAQAVPTHLVQTLASKLVMQGIPYMVNSQGQVQINQGASAATKLPASAVRFLTPSGTFAAKLPAGTPLNQIKLVTSETKTSTPQQQQQQVIFFKAGGSNVGTLGSLPIQLSAPLVSHSSIVTTQQNVTMIKTGFPGARLVTVASPTTLTAAALTAQQSATPFQTKLTIPLSAIQSLPNVNIKQNTLLSANAPALIQQDQIPKVTPVPAAITKVNPKVQTNLLNMVLARMAQPVVSSATNTPLMAPSTKETTAQPSQPNIATITSTMPNLPTLPTTEDSKQAPSSSSLAPGIALYCNKCKHQLASLEEMSAHKCVKGSGSSISWNAQGFSLQAQPGATLDTGTAVSKMKCPVSTPKYGKVKPVGKESGPMTVIDEVQGKIKCSKCPFNHSDINIVTNHMRDEHKIHLHECPHCRQGFDSPKSLEIHYALDHNFECTLCHVRLNRQLLRTHASQHCTWTLTPCFQCLTCKGIFLTFDKYKKHMESCSSSPILKPARHTVNVCDGCELTSRRRQDIFNHVKRVHIQKVEYKCSVCDHVFQNIAGVKANIGFHLSKHCPNNEDADFCFCHTCWLVFPDKDSLEKHQSSIDHVGKIYRNAASQASVEEKMTSREGRSADNPIAHPEGNSQQKETSFITQKANFELKTAGGSTETCPSGVKWLHHYARKNQCTGIHCEECNRVFTSLFSLKQHKVIQHRAVRHKSGQKRKRVALTRVRMTGVPIKKELLTCEGCTESFPTRTRLRLHRSKCKIGGK